MLRERIGEDDPEGEMLLRGEREEGRGRWCSRSSKPSARSSRAGLNASEAARVLGISALLKPRGVLLSLSHEFTGEDTALERVRTPS